MVDKFHISDSGEVVTCEAALRECPRENYDTREAAERALETLGGGTLPQRPSRAARDLSEAQGFYGGDYVSPHTMALAPGVEQALDDLRDIGNPLIVGGAVRDSLVGAENKDIDIEVHGTTIDELAQHLRSRGYSVDEVGREFGVLKVSRGSTRDLDVSVPRRENRMGAGHRSFEVEMSPDLTVGEAAERRDFTFNAMMYDHHRGMLVDPAGGSGDFANRTMRHVSEKFREDPLRVLRGFQFASRFGMELDPSTAALSRELRSEYDTLSIERVQEEWGKFYEKGTDPRRGIAALQASGWDDTIPGLAQSLRDPRTQDALERVAHLPRDERVLQGAATIAHGMDVAKRRNFIRATVLGAREQKRVEVLASLNPVHMATSHQRKVMADGFPQGLSFGDYATFAQVIGSSDGMDVAGRAEEDGLLSGPEPMLVQGRDVLGCTDRQPGPWLGNLLRVLKDEQYHGRFPTREAALARMGELLG